jgi:hypothetical protein
MHLTGTITGWFLVGSGLGGMLLPWLIGQAFVQVGAGAMMGMIFLNIVLNVVMLFLFARISTKPDLAVESRATAD